MGKLLLINMILCAMVSLIRFWSEIDFKRLLELLKELGDGALIVWICGSWAATLGYIIYSILRALS